MLTVKELMKRARAGAGGMPQTPPATKHYKIGEHTILLNQEHLLPAYQAQHRLYDRFLPILCKELDDPDLWIIDVGANVGDTAVALAQSCQNPMLCIEGEEEFFKLLRHNAETLFANRKRAVICLSAMVGSDRFSGSLRRNGTTASLAEDQAAGQRAASLDTLARDSAVPATAVALIKVDTDGYDGDVILSAPDILAASKPILFWENYFSTIGQMRELEALYQRLDDSGYRRFWIFDNYGNLLLRECSLGNIIDINEYVASQE
ncbi:MAG TPA: FkbM family methyltransferase, partial [Methylocella sp.]|nr:FkbM family methyltransferase [Methylocella sp.]